MFERLARALVEQGGKWPYGRRLRIQQHLPFLNSEAMREWYYHTFWSDSYVVGDYSYGTPRIWWRDEGSVLKIGRFCSIARGVNVILGGDHRVDWVTTYPFMTFPHTWPEARGAKGHPQSKGNVVICNDVWIGYGSTILSGVTIGDGAVVGAMSVVTKDVEPYTIVAGNPARVIGKRFDSETVRQLLEIEWWHWPRDRIGRNMPLLLDERVDLFLSSQGSA